ncbi:MAG: RNA polymerase factor sigma-54 [Alphaproteobacteria bacterium]
MAISPRLDLRQSQSLVMTPQLQQAIKLLQLSNMELAAYVEQELEQNPLLEREEAESTGSQPGADAPSGEPEGDGAIADTRDLTAPDHLPNGDDAPLDADFDNVWTDDGPGESDGALSMWGVRGGRGFDAGDADFEQTVSRDVSLRDYLTEQLMVDIDDPVDRIIGVHLIDMLDEAGYVSGGLAPVAEQLGCSEERVLVTLGKLQSFDPPGIFARNLAECLAQQLADRDRLDPAMRALVDNLDKLARHDMAALKKLCGVDDEDLTDMVAELRSLDPKPALAFDNAVAQTVTPDVLMHPRPGGGWHIELNAGTLPRVLVNERYYTEVSDRVRDKKEKSYISERFQAANWLVKTLHQRAQTILKVASEIVRQQERFFAKGVSHLKPLVLRDIATAIEMHESTVSRVTANKYMATPRGTFELKYFFSSAIPGKDGGETHSAKAVRFRIKALIDQELPGAILSDDRIVALLQGDGIEIARRTVAKYREAMKIPSSVQRRRAKAGMS